MKKYVVTLLEEPRVFGIFNSKEVAGRYIYDNYIEPHYEPEEIVNFISEYNSNINELYKEIDAYATVIELEGIE